MGSGKRGSQTRPVFDYHLSIDYGVCLGPIDHWNKGWIKDKTVFCGIYSGRTDVDVNLPDLFGGDDAEGGPVGTIELYTGQDTQLSSWELATRWNRTPQTAPGYRGLAHWFFRGARDRSVVEQEINSSGVSALLALLFSSVARVTVGAAFTGSTAPSVGFKWTANNPYLPAVKASVTRLSKTGFADPYQAIWPGAGLDENGNIVGLASVDQVPVTSPPTPSYAEAEGTFDIGLTDGGVVDLYALGFSPAEITAGNTKITAEWFLDLISYYTYGPADNTATTEFRFYGDFGQPPNWDAANQIAPVTGEEALASQDQTVTVAASERERGGGGIGRRAREDITSAEITAPSGARYVRVRGTFVLAQDVVARTPAQTGNYHDEWLYDNPNAGYTIGSFGEGGIQVRDTGDPIVDPPDAPAAANAPPNDTPRVFLQGTPDIVSNPTDVSETIIDLIEAGYTQAEIDAGRVYVRGGWAMSYTGTSVGKFTNFEISFHTDAPVANNTQYLVTPDGFHETPSTQAVTNTHSLDDIVAPPTSRYVQIAAREGSGFGEGPVVSENYWQIYGMSYGAQHCAGDDLLGPLPDANPARMIWECMINPEWGKGEDPALMDSDSFDVAAEALFNERFGLSMGFFEQDTIENFIQEILDHIQAFLYQDPSTGLWTLKLLRNDYDVDALETLDESNCTATNRRRRLWGETINEIVVSYTDPNTEKPVTVSAWDLGNVQIQGGVISETRDYYGIRNALLATVVANRDVRSASYPLFSCTVAVDRREWDARPGDLRKFSWAEDGISDVVCRVMHVDYGSPRDRKITLKLTEDIFSIDQAQYGVPQTSSWENVERAPQPPETQTAWTVPLPVLLRNGGDLDTIDGDAPIVVGAIYADDEAFRPTEIEVWSEVVKNNGDTEIRRITKILPVYSALLMNALPQEASSTISRVQIDAIMRGQPVEAGAFFTMGLSERVQEIVMLDSYDAATETWTVARGMWDTVPLYWPAGVRMWKLAETLATADTNERASGDAVTYYLLPKTSLGTLDFADAVPLTVTYTDRPFAPFRPANAQLDGQGFGGVVVRSAPFPTEIEATWKNRNRTTEDQVSLRWGDDSAAMEVGQTVTLRVLDDLGNEHGTITGLTGESHTISAASLPPGLEGYIEFISERDGYTSPYGARRYFDIRPPTGYGLAYGLGYGENEP